MHSLDVLRRLVDMDCFFRVLELLRKKSVAIVPRDDTSCNGNHVVGRIDVSLPNHQTVGASSDKMFARDVRVIVGVVSGVAARPQAGQLAVVLASRAHLRRIILLGHQDVNAVHLLESMLNPIAFERRRMAF